MPKSLHHSGCSVVPNDEVDTTTAMLVSNVPPNASST